MTVDKPFGYARDLQYLAKLHREGQDLLRFAFGSQNELQQKMLAMRGLFPALTEARQGAIAGIAAIQNSTLRDALQVAEAHSRQWKMFERLASPLWMTTLQKTAFNINRDTAGILDTQRFLAASSASHMQSLAQMLAGNQASLAAILGASDWTDKFKTLRLSVAENLGGIRLAAQLAQSIDMATLRATADQAAKSAAVIAAEQVLEAHRLIEAIGQTETPEQNATLLATFVSVIGALFQGFNENTTKELQSIGAFKIVELFLVIVTIFQLLAPQNLSPSAEEIYSEMRGEVEKIREKLDQILAANAEAESAYLKGLQRAELKRVAPFRSEPSAEATILMRGDKGWDPLESTCRHASLSIL